MKYFSAQYIFTGKGLPLKQALICTEDDGTIISVTDTGGRLKERHSVEFYNGIIVPGFINCHCHLELSYLKDEIQPGIGLGRFLRAVTTTRDTIVKDRSKAIENADYRMSDEGVVVCADICNSALTFDIKRKSKIKYINLLEVYGIDSVRAQARMDEIAEIARSADKVNVPWFIVPHSAYSVSLPLFKKIKDITGSNKLTSLHFMESEDEITFLENHSGPLMDAYQKLLSPSSRLDIVRNHVSAVYDEITRSGNLILVHNTVIKKKHIDELRRRENLYYCLCPNSNKFIENKIPPAGLLFNEHCNIVIGTDSLSSNRELSVVDELKTLQEYYPWIDLNSLLVCATLNGAKAVQEDDWAGSIEPGKRPGLVLIKDLDLLNMRLLPSTVAHRII
jgi:cytosine/adenosine deaminase-related metal-dependent hydrolase